MGSETTFVLVSHSSRDKTAAREAALFLVAEGVDVWFDEWRIELGDSIPEKIEEGLAEASHLVLMWSQHAASSGWVSRERRSALAAAIDRGRPKVLPVRLDDEPLPALMSDITYMRWRGGSEEARRELVDSILARKASGDFVRAVVGKYRELVYDEDLFKKGDPFGILACPTCGSSALVRNSALDEPHDEMYYFIKCRECGWSDWTQ